jgi:hypothetical protein
MNKQSPENTGKELRKKYGVYGLSIIQIVGLILLISLTLTVAYQFIA